MGTESLVYINGELLCYTRYDGQPFNLGEDLRRVRTDWKEILRICKAHSILAVSLKFWLKNPEFVYNCYPIDRKDTCKKILKPEVQKELEGKLNKDEIEEAITKLKSSGDVFEPRRGYVQKT